MRNSMYPLASLPEMGVYARCTSSPVSLRLSRTKTCCPIGSPRSWSGDGRAKRYRRVSWFTTLRLIRVTCFHRRGERQ